MNWCSTAVVYTDSKSLFAAIEIGKWKWMCVCVCVCALEILVLCALLHMKFDKSTNISTLVNNINVSCANVQTSAICSLNVIIQCCYITPLLHQTNSIPTASYVVLVMCYVYFLMSVFVCVFVCESRKSSPTNINNSDYWCVMAAHRSHEQLPHIIHIYIWYLVALRKCGGILPKHV